MRRVVFKRAAAETPGKHGQRDWRVTMNGAAPTHSELLFMLGMHLLAEDRYDAPHQEGRYRLWRFVDLLLTARTPERVTEIATDCQDDVETSRARRSVAEAPYDWQAQGLFDEPREAA